MSSCSTNEVNYGYILGVKLCFLLTLFMNVVCRFDFVVILDNINNKKEHRWFCFECCACL